MTDFDTFWQAYPKRETPRGVLVRPGKKPARDLYNQIIRAGEWTHDMLCHAAKQYAKATDPHFVRDCHRWLRDEDYDAGYEPASNNPTFEQMTEDERQRLAKTVVTNGEQFAITNAKYRPDDVRAARAAGYMGPRRTG